MNNFITSFERSLQTGFVDKGILSEEFCRPKLLINTEEPVQKVLLTIEQELKECSEFCISAAFVTSGGVASLHQTLVDLDKKDIKGKVLVSQYLNFTSPEALRKLLNFKNIELRIAESQHSLHAKAYIFKKKYYYDVIIGSSNLTSGALSKNKEWNLKVSGLHSSEIVDSVLVAFEADFKAARLVTEDFINEYQKIYDNEKRKREQMKSSLLESDEDTLEIKPNIIQEEALQKLQNLREEGKNKALIISATGTGKTYLAAFDVRAQKPRKMLFVVHRLNIARKALETFQRLFKDKTFGLYSGKERDLDADFIFSTVQTISKEEHLSQFKKDYFDYIIIDESHRSGAVSYRRLLEYFQPKFLLGMTATPERTDGSDIFGLFDHNIAYEIRLDGAMKAGLLSEFHYFGITDLIVNDEKFENNKDFRLLNNNERAKRIFEKAELYGTYNGVVRGLVFCSRNEEAMLFAESFNRYGYKTVALSGESSEEEREEAIRLLESDNLDEKLDYIITVDIFNEGIDIPKVNQIIMVRPTESAIIFVQQLGRGLRKVEGKEYLTIIDFIGNYENNYLIPVALYGDTSFNKDKLRRVVSEGSGAIPGSSTIHFDEISKEKIFKSIDASNMTLLVDLKKDYDLLKYRLGRIPMMVDFLKNNSRDPFLFVEYSSSYYEFVKKVEKNFKGVLNKEDTELLKLFSFNINNGQRVEESYILRELIQHKTVTIDTLKQKIHAAYGYTVKNETIESCIINLNFDFINNNKNIDTHRDIVIKKGNIIEFSTEFLEKLDKRVFREFLSDSTEYSILTYNEKHNADLYRDGFLLYNKYSRKDVCRLLNWEKNPIPQNIGGYITQNNITPCFVTYHKSKDIGSSINYNDYFVSPSVFAWESKSKRNINSKDVQKVINSERILLFVKKDDDEGHDFYYMGDCTIIDGSIQEAKMPDSGHSVVHFQFQLEQPVEDKLYRYITKT